MEGLEQALLELQQLTERLRRECPWDREQTARTIVPHTVEEAYEVADAALAGDDDEAARRARRPALPGLLPRAAARGARQGRPREARAADPREARPPAPARLRRRRGGDGGPRQGELGPDQARAGGPRRRLPRRARGAAGAAATRGRCSSARSRSASSIPTSTARVADLDDEMRELKDDLGSAERRAEELGDVLFAAVNVARKLDVDPELELRRATAALPRPRRSRRAARARRTAKIGAALPLEQQDRYFDLAKEKPNEPIAARARPPDPRLARQPDDRGRRPARVGRGRPRRGPVGRVDRRARGGRAARRRRGVRRQGASRRRSRTRTARSPRRCAGSTRPTRRRSTAR